MFAFDCKPNFYIDKALETQAGVVTALADMTQVEEEFKKKQPWGSCIFYNK
jgi:hypothetical protein